MEKINMIIAQIKNIYHVGFIVKDIDRTLDFYIGKLGFVLHNRWTEPVEEAEDGFGISGASLELAQVKGYGCTLEFIQFLTSSGKDTPIAPNHIGIGHVSFIVEDIEIVKKLLESEGIVFCSDLVRLRKSSWVMFHDPDNIRIEIMQFHPGSGLY